MALPKHVIPVVLAVTILVAGMFAFMPVQKSTTVHNPIIDAINAGNTALALELLEDLGGGHDDLGVGHFNITAELQDKIKLLNATDNELIEFSPRNVIGATITVNATNAENELVVFNLKEVYLCGDVDNGRDIVVKAIWIENVVFNEMFGNPEDADIVIKDIYGNSLDIPLIGGETCVDIISSLANPGFEIEVCVICEYSDNGRGVAGAVGLGSDTDLVIELSSQFSGQLDFVKCIAFTPNEAVELACDLEPIQDFF